ncbi:AMP-binding protein [Psychrobacter alimentarius]|uniref:AMP-binding protein n=1 Tax=Psychrobacter alimentarius TaxID=261164 RepID=UPI00191A9C1D|nr:AMP-binding protein [Psychrobacter alimentarius]
MTPIYTAICEHARKAPKQVAIKTVVGEHTVSLTYDALQRTLALLHQTLHTWQGRRVALYAHNEIDWVILDLALSTVGAVVIPIPLFFSTSQVAHLLQDAQIELVYVGAGLTLPAIHDVDRVNHNVNNWVIAKTAEVAALKLEHAAYITGEFYQLNNDAADTLTSQASATASEFCKVTYTSGSTGMPKGVCLGQDTLMRIVESLAEALADTLTDDAVNPLDITSHFGHLSVLPFATLLENVAGVYVSLYMGRTLVIGKIDQFGLLSNQAFDAKRLITTVQTHRIASVILLPQMLKAICEYMATNKNPDARTSAALPSLRFMAVGGGKVSPTLLQEAKALSLPVYEGYGLSECGSVVSLNTPKAKREGSVGKPMPHASVSIAASGEVMVKGNAMQGYLNHDTSSEDMNNKDNGIIATGDIGYVDNDGYLYITGRRKNVLISSFGRNISPEWVEAQLLTQPIIYQAAVLGDGEPSLSAVIVANPNEVATNRSDLQSAIKHAIETVNQALPDYARIKHWHLEKQSFSTDNGLLTDNGKLRRPQIFTTYKSVLGL